MDLNFIVSCSIRVVVILNLFCLRISKGFFHALMSNNGFARHSLGENYFSYIRILFIWQLTYREGIIITPSSF